MLTKSFAEISRRRFLAAGSISVAAVWLHPRALFARPGDEPRRIRFKASRQTRKPPFKDFAATSVPPGAVGNIAVLRAFEKSTSRHMRYEIWSCVSQAEKLPP
jgi:hypothetical protein